MIVRRVFSSFGVGVIPAYFALEVSSVPDSGSSTLRSERPKTTHDVAVS